MTKKFILVLAILAIAVSVAVLGYLFFWPKLTDNNINVNQNKGQVNTTKGIEIKPTMDTSNWLTYRNEKYGYEFKYPNNWERVGGLDESVGFSPKNRSENYSPFFIIEVDGNNSNNLSIREIFRLRGWPSDRSDVFLDNKNIQGITIDLLSKEYYEGNASISFTANGYVFHIKWGDNLRDAQDAYEIFLNMLTTFHFFK